MKIELPFDVGYKVYPLTYGYYPEMFVISISIWADKTGEVFWECEMESCDHECYDTFDMNDLNKSIFLDKEERDKLLHELNLN